MQIDYGKDVEWIRWVQSGIQHVITISGTQAPKMEMRLPSGTDNDSMIALQKLSLIHI